jgi:hypothetical protein
MTFIEHKFSGWRIKNSLSLNRDRRKKGSGKIGATCIYCV